jgi:hypothetical protein
MPYQYPPAFRQDFIDRMLRAESVRFLAMESGVPLQTLHRWKSKHLSMQGFEKASPRVSSVTFVRRVNALWKLRTNCVSRKMRVRFLIRWRWWTQKKAIRRGRTRYAQPFLTQSHENGWCPTFHLRCPDTA